MEQRTLELIAEGSSLGDSYQFQVQAPGSTVHLDEPAVFRLSLTPEGKSQVPEALRFEKGTDVVGPDSRWEGEPRQDGSVLFDVPLVFRGRKGPCILKVIIKSEEFRATLAITELNMDLASTKLGVDIPGWPIRWNGSSPLKLNVSLSHRGEGKVKVQASVQLLDANGSILVKGSSREITVKNSSNFSTQLDPNGDISPEGLSLKVDLLVDGEHQEHLLKEAVLPEKEDKIKASIPGRVTSGTDVAILFAVPEKLSMDGLVMDIGDIEGIEPLSVKGEGSSFEAVFSMPDMKQGMVPIILRAGEKEIARSPVFVDREELFSSVELNIDPKTPSPGEEVRIRINVRGQIDNREVDARLEMEGKGPKTMDLGRITADKPLEFQMKIPGDINIGDIGGRLVMSEGEKELWSKVYSRLISVRSRSGLGLKVIVPGSMDPDRTDKLLFPGERFTGSRKYSEAEIKLTSTGRILIYRNGKHLPDKEEGRELASRLVVLDTYLNTLSRPEVSSPILEAIKHIKDVSAFLLKCSDRSKPLKDQSYLSRLSRHFKGSGKEPALRIHSSDGKDPVPNLSIVLKEIFSGYGTSSGSDPSRSLRELTEHMMMGLKGRNNSFERGVSGKTLMEIAKRAEEALKSLSGLLGQEEVDMEEADRVLRKACFYLISIQIVRAELFSRWSDPVVNAWNQLRIERQRAIKGSIQAVGDVVTAIIDIHQASIRRWNAYEKNLGSRIMMAALDDLEIDIGEGGFSGVSGEIWDCNVRISSREGSPVMDIVPIISLPRGGWTLEEPLSSREDGNLVMDTIRIGKGERIDLLLRVRSPLSSPGGSDALVYLYPEGIKLEEEP